MAFVVLTDVPFLDSHSHHRRGHSILGCDTCGVVSVLMLTEQGILGTLPDGMQGFPHTRRECMMRQYSSDLSHWAPAVFFVDVDEQPAVIRCLFCNSMLLVTLNHNLWRSAVIDAAPSLRHEESCPIGERGLEAMRQAFAGIVNECEIQHNVEITVGENSLRMLCRGCGMVIERSIYLLPDRQTLNAMWGPVMHRGECPVPFVGAALDVSGAGALAGMLDGLNGAAAASATNSFSSSSPYVTDSVNTVSSEQTAPERPYSSVAQPSQTQLTPEEIENVTNLIMDSRQHRFFNRLAGPVEQSPSGFRYAVTIRVPAGGARFVYTEEVDSFTVFHSSNTQSSDLLRCADVSRRRSSCPVMFPRCVHLYIDPCPALHAIAYFNTMEESERFAAWMCRAMGTDGQAHQHGQPQVRQPQKRLVIATG